MAKQHTELLNLGLDLVQKSIPESETVPVCYVEASLGEYVRIGLPIDTPHFFAVGFTIERMLRNLGSRPANKYNGSLYDYGNEVRKGGVTYTIRGVNKEDRNHDIPPLDLAEIDTARRAAKWLGSLQLLNPSHSRLMFTNPYLVRAEGRYLKPEDEDTFTRALQTNSANPGRVFSEPVRDLPFVMYTHKGRLGISVFSMIKGY